MSLSLYSTCVYTVQQLQMQGLLLAWDTHHAFILTHQEHCPAWLFNCASALTAVKRALLMQKAALLRLIEEAVKSMLTRCFQKYHAVSDRAPTGILEGDMANPESPSSVLRHAVKLAGDDTLLALSFGALRLKG